MAQNIGNNIVRLEVVDSTNNYANRQMVGNVVTEGTVFLAQCQTSGRGQQKNAWESASGENLLFSIVLSPDFLEVRDQFMLSKVTTLGIYMALNKYVADLKVKWPNDIYAGNKKLGGILIEHSIMGGRLKSSVIGIGINVNQILFLSDAPNPTSLKILTKEHFETELIFSEILLAIDFYYNRLKGGDFDTINLEFQSVLYRINERHLYKSGDEVFEGVICGVNEIGQLIIEKRDGQLSEFHFKEVEFVLD